MAVVTAEGMPAGPMVVEPQAAGTAVEEAAMVEARGDQPIELRFLEREVYLRAVDLRREHITAYERHRAP